MAAAPAAVTKDSHVITPQSVLLLMKLINWIVEHWPIAVLIALFLTGAILQVTGVLQ